MTSTLEGCPVLSSSCDPLRRRPKTSLSLKARRGAPVSKRKNLPTQESLAADPTREPVDRRTR